MGSSPARRKGPAAGRLCPTLAVMHLVAALALLAIGAAVLPGASAVCNDYAAMVRASNFLYPANVAFPSRSDAMLTGMPYARRALSSITSSSYGMFLARQWRPA